MDIQRQYLDRVRLLIDRNEAARREFLDSGRMLVHYTKPDTAKKILNSRELWLCNARNPCMPDEEEIIFGRKCVQQFLNSNEARLHKALDSIEPGLSAALLDVWNLEHEAHLEKTYISCFTDHEANEHVGSDHHWGNYGQVALFLDPAFMRDDPSNRLSLYLVKVNYGKDTAERLLLEWLTAIEENCDFLKESARFPLLSLLRHQLFFVSVSTKGDNFSAEKEWRVIHAPWIFSSAHVWRHPDCDEDLPVGVLPLRFNHFQGLDLPELEIKNLFRKILVNSSANDAAHLRLDLIFQLANNNISNAKSLVHLTPPKGDSGS